MQTKFLNDAWCSNNSTGNELMEVDLDPPHTVLYEAMEITPPPVEPLQADAGRDATICGGKLSLGGSPTASGGTAPYLYQWSPTTGLSSSTIANPIASPRSTTTYILSVTDATGLVTTAKVTVEVNLKRVTPPISPAGPLTICEGASVKLECTKKFVRYLWSTGDTTDAIQVSSSGKYHVTAWNIQGCSARSDEIEVNVTRRPELVISGQLGFCDSTGDAEYKLIAPSLLSVVWSVVGGNFNSGFGTSTVRIHWFAAPLHVLLLNVVDANGCFWTERVDIEMGKSLKPGLSLSLPYQVCEGDTLVVGCQAGLASYKWSTGDTMSYTRITDNTPFFVLVSDNAGCRGSSDTLSYVFQKHVKKPTISHTGNVLTSSSALRYQWKREGVIIKGATNQTLNVNIGGSYRVVASADGMCDTESDPVITNVTNIHSTEESRTLFPNPSSTVLHVQEPLNVLKYICRDLTGREVLTRSINAQSFDVEVQDLDPGFYLLELQTSLCSQVRCFVKE